MKRNLLLITFILCAAWTLASCQPTATGCGDSITIRYASDLNPDNCVDFPLDKGWIRDTALAWVLVESNDPGSIEVSEPPEHGCWNDHPDRCLAPDDKAAPEKYYYAYGPDNGEVPTGFQQLCEAASGLGGEFQAGPHCGGTGGL